MTSFVSTFQFLMTLLEKKERKKKKLTVCSDTQVTASGALPSFCWISKLIEFVDKHRIKIIGNR